MKSKIEELRAKLNRWNHEYYELDAPTVSDSVYDQALKELFELESANPELITEDSPTQTVGRLEQSTFEKTKHEYPMYSLKNAFTVEELEKLEEVGDILQAEPKIDGMSISLVYRNGKLTKAITRGDGQIGEDITNNVKMISDIPNTLNDEIDITIRGEIFMKQSVFEKLNEQRLLDGEQPFANPRNAASGTMRQLDPKIVRDRNLSMLAYECIDENSESPSSIIDQNQKLDLLEKLGMQVVEKYTVASLSLIEEMEDDSNIYSYEEVINKVSELDEDIPTDGVVFKVSNLEKQKSAGFTSKFPKWALAYKFAEQVEQTELLDIFPTVGRTGMITYNAKLAPVEIDGSVIQAATLHNANYIQDLGLRIGDTVNVKKAGEIIPKVTSVVAHAENSVKWVQSTHCPECGAELIMKDGLVDQFCNNSDCKGKLIQRITHFVSRNGMDIVGLSEKLIEKLVEESLISRPSDLFKISKEELLNLDGIQDKLATNIINSISKAANVNLSNFIYALGIPLVGNTYAKKIANAAKKSGINKLETVLLWAPDKLIKESGIGQAACESIKTYVDHNQEELTELSNVLNIETQNFKSTYKVEFQPGQVDLTGKNVVVTGTVEGGNRDEVKQAIEELGAIIKSGVSSNTDYILIGENPSQNKLSKIDKSKIIKIRLTK